MTHLIKNHVSNKAKSINLNVLNLITKKLNQKNSQNMYHANVNINLIIENLTQIRSMIAINIDLNAKIQETSYE